MDESATEFYNKSINILVNSIKDTVDDKLAKAYTKIVYDKYFLGSNSFMSPGEKHTSDEIKQFLSDVKSKLYILYPTLKITKCDAKYKLTFYHIKVEGQSKLTCEHILRFDIQFTAKNTNSCVCS
jgi:hypothetical protein